MVQSRLWPWMLVQQPAAQTLHTWGSNSLAICRRCPLRFAKCNCISLVHAQRAQSHLQSLYPPTGWNTFSHFFPFCNMLPSHMTLLGRPRASLQVPRLVLTSHGSEVSAQLRKAAMRAVASQFGEVWRIGYGDIWPHSDIM